MSFDALRKAVDDRIISNWTETGLNAVDFGDNNAFNTPVSSEWIRISTVVFNSENAAVGSNFQRSEGEIIVQCFTPINTGEKRILELIDHAASIFQNQNFNGVRCFATKPVRVGIRDNWFQFNANTFFQYDVHS